LFDKVSEVKDSAEIVSLLHQTIQKVSEDIEVMHFNTAVSQMMQFSNEMQKQESISKETYTTLVQLLAPFAPHMTEELWSRLGGQGSIAYAPWPQFNPELAKETSITIVVQVNGKVRDSFDASPDIIEEEAKQKALGLENVIKHLAGQEPKKVIYVKGKLVSIVV
jgi:leucyl-tRNA synthetase